MAVLSFSYFSPWSTSAAPSSSSSLSSSSSSHPRSLGSIIRSGVLTVLAVACVTTPAAVDAHGYVTYPSPEFTGGMKTEYSATMSPPPEFKGKFDGNPQENVNAFTREFYANQGKYPDLKTLTRGQGKDCGNTNEFANPQPIPEGDVVVWKNPDSLEGFVPSHTGPCEIWLGDTRVFNNDNCAAAFAGKTEAKIQVDFSACTGNKCLLQFYWLALHEPAWQVYKNCVPLIGNGRGPYTGGNAKVKTEAGEYGNEYNKPSEYGNEYNKPSKNSKCHPKRKRALRG